MANDTANDRVQQLEKDLISNGTDAMKHFSEQIHSMSQTDRNATFNQIKSDFDKRNSAGEHLPQLTLTSDSNGNVTSADEKYPEMLRNAMNQERTQNIYSQDKMQTQFNEITQHANPTVNSNGYLDTIMKRIGL